MAGNSVTKVIGPVVCMAHGKVGEGFGVGDEVSSFTKLVGFDVEEVEVATLEEGTTRGDGGGGEEWEEVCLIGGKVVCGVMVEVSVVEVEVVVETGRVVGAEAGVGVSEEVSVGGCDVAGKFFKGEVEGIGVNDKDGWEAEWVGFKAHDVCMGFAVADVGIFVSLLRWDEACADENRDSGFAFPVMVEMGGWYGGEDHGAGV